MKKPRDTWLYRGFIIKLEAGRTRPYAVFDSYDMTAASLRYTILIGRRHTLADAMTCIDDCLGGNIGDVIGSKET